MSVDGMAIFPNWPEIMERVEDANLQEAERTCAKWGHDFYTCPACTDRACLRCGLPDA